MLYHINNLIKRFDTKTILNLDDLPFKRGLVYGLLGPNGAGKTTLLEILAFLLPPTSGSVLFEDEIVNYTKGNLINLRKRVVLVQQHPIMFSTSVFQNVEFPMKIRKVPASKRKKSVEDLLALVGMEDFRDAKAHRLSGGETQRVAIAQALACSPSVVLLDEPTASVDVENQIIIERIIKDISRENGISVILTTHDMVQASRVADEIIYIYEGKLTRSKQENIFNGSIKRDPGGKSYCVIQEGLRFMVNSKRSGPVRISINPEWIDMNPDIKAISDESLYKGKLLQLTDEKEKIRVLVDIGIPISVLISKEIYSSFKLNMGGEITINCPPESIDVF